MKWQRLNISRTHPLGANGQKVTASKAHTRLSRLRQQRKVWYYSQPWSCLFFMCKRGYIYTAESSVCAALAVTFWPFAPSGVRPGYLTSATLHFYPFHLVFSDY